MHNFWERNNNSRQRLGFEQFIACLRTIASLVMKHRAQEEQLEVHGETREFKLDELFFKFI